MRARDLIPQLVATFTGPRDCVVPGVDFKWSSKSITHNVFRFLELTFGRKSGVRVESMMHYDTDSNQTIYRFFTLEAYLVHLEYKLRAFEMPSFRFVSVRYLQPVGVPMQVAIPIFDFAIAYDNKITATNGTSVTTCTTGSFSISGSNITVGVFVGGQESSLHSVTTKWGGSGGTTMTQANSGVWVSGAALSVYPSYIGGLSTDSQTVYADFGANTQSRISVGAISLTGTHSSPLGNTNTNSSTTYGSGSTVSLTTGSDNSMILTGCQANTIGATTAGGTNQTERYSIIVPTNDHDAMGSTQTTTTAGSYTSSWTWVGTSGGWVINAMEIKVAATTATYRGFFAMVAKA